MNPEEQSVYEHLPDDGSEITYDAWKDAVLASRGNVQLTRTLKRKGFVYFRVEQNEQGGLDLFVSRASQEG